MKITKGKIILAIVVIYFIIFAVINVNKEKNYNQDILENAVFVTDGQVNAENEGKIVVVSGKVEYDEAVTFLELEDFSSIKVNRKVEDYLRVEKGDKTTNQWVERLEPLSNPDGDFLKELVSEEKVSKVSIGEFVLDQKGLELIPTDSYYSKQEFIGELTTSGIDYMRDPHEEDLRVGDMRITYKYYDLDKYPNMSILAVQKGNSFEPYQVDKKTSVYQIFTKKVTNKEALEEELKTNVKKTTKGKTLFILMILGAGIFFIVDNKKRD